MNDRLITVADVVERTSFKEATVRSKVLKREWPFVKIGRSIRFKESFINSLIAAAEVPARKQRVA